MILAHERTHARALHSLDILVLEAVRLLLWIHPLPILYKRLLREAHEGEADSAAADSPERYGRFLLDQAMLGGMPTLTHLFHQSPIRHRILMLTRAKKSPLRFLVALPLCAALLICCTAGKPTAEGSAAAADTAKGKRRSFTMSEEIRNEEIVRDPRTGEIDTTTNITRAHPVKMNGETIYNATEVTRPVRYLGPGKTATDGIMQVLEAQFAVLPNGRYLMFPTIGPIIDKSGEMVYMDDPMVLATNGANTEPLARAITNATQYKLRFAPAEVSGQPVIAYAGDDATPFGGFYTVMVENGKATASSGIVVGEMGTTPKR